MVGLITVRSSRLLLHGVEIVEIVIGSQVKTSGEIVILSRTVIAPLVVHTIMSGNILMLTNVSSSNAPI